MDCSSNFCDDFLDKDIRDVVNKYDSFRKNAIFNKRNYVDLRNELSNHIPDLNKKEAWKRKAYSKFSNLISICESWQAKGQKLETCKSLYGELINEFIIDPIDEISADWEWKTDPKIKYAMIHLLLDVLYSYCDAPRIIHFSAVVYDKIVEMGKQNSKIGEFYGSEAEEHILNYVLDTISLICKSERKSVEIYIGDVSPKLTKRFSQEFCEKLLKKYEKQKVGQDNKKYIDAGADIGRYKDKKEQEIIDFGKETYEKPKTYVEEKKEDRTKYIVITLCAVIIAVILFTAGIWIGKNKNAGMQENPELQKRIEQLEEQQKQQSEQIKNIKDALLDLETELILLKQDTTNEINNEEINNGEENSPTNNPPVEENPGVTTQPSAGN